jgi:hypothetical protein
MTSTRAFRIASTLWVLLAANAPAEDYPVTKDALYSAMGVMTNLADKRVRADLKLTPEQDKAVVANTTGGWKWFKDVGPDELKKITGPDREAKIRARFTQQADDTFAAAGKVLKPGQIARLKQIMLQQRGITLFDYPEIRQDLKLDSTQVKRLRQADEKLRAEVGKDLGKVSRAEANKKWNAVIFGVPDRVRAELTASQRGKLTELLGEPFAFNE